MGMSTGSAGRAYGSGFYVEWSNKALKKINLDEFLPQETVTDSQTLVGLTGQAGSNWRIAALNL